MLWETVLLALRAIRRNVLRSSLTVLGIVIGVAAVIAMVTLGGGATAQVRANIASLGSNLLIVRPGQEHRGGSRQAAPQFKAADAEAIAREVGGVAAAAPSVQAPTQAIAGNRNWATSVTGTTNDFLRVRNWTIARGQAFSPGEMRAGAAVCILGETVRKELFGGDAAVGSTIRLEKLACKVIGVLAPKGQSSFGRDQDDFVLMPLRAVQRRIVGNSDVSIIYVSARDGASTEKVKSDIEAVMRERRHVPAGDESNFFVRDMQEIATALAGTMKVLTALLSAVAAVSLLVGGIGIMNIMLVSVTERTREIGTRLAIGARERDVLLQFLVESVVLASLGGVIGIALGLGGSAAATGALEVPFVLNVPIVFEAFAFSAAVGIVFGFFPARKAARLDPIEALRHE